MGIEKTEVYRATCDSCGTSREAVGDDSRSDFADWVGFSTQKGLGTCTVAGALARVPVVRRAAAA